MSKPWGHHFHFSVYVEGEMPDIDDLSKAASGIEDALGHDKVDFIGVRMVEPVDEKPWDQIAT